MPSHNASVAVKAPQRRRGRERVAGLLDAAAQVFAEKGYDTATMAEIAARADAAIGSLYQFFPNKELLAGALRAQYGDAICARLEAMREPAAKWKKDDLADHILDAMLDFQIQHPAFTALVEARAGLSGSGASAVRARLRGAIRDIIRVAAPHLGDGKAQAIAIVIQHTMKAVAAITAEAKLSRHAILDEMRAMLRLYLLERIGKT